MSNDLLSLIGEIAVALAKAINQKLKLLSLIFSIRNLFDFIASDMKLTFVLFRRNRLPNGHLFRGKDRLVQKVEPKHIRQIKQDFDIEEKNMFYLRFPYLTEAESSGHTQALGKREMRRENLYNQQRRIFKEDVTLYERLRWLRVKESWE